MLNKRAEREQIGIAAKNAASSKYEEDDENEFNVDDDNSS